MAQTTIPKLFLRLQRLDGRSLALRRSAELLEREAVSGDIGPAVKPLRSSALYDTMIPEGVVRDILDDLRAQAKALERRRDCLIRKKLNIEADDASGDDEDELVTPISSKKYRIVTNQ